MYTFVWYLNKKEFQSNFTMHSNVVRGASVSPLSNGENRSPLALSVLELFQKYPTELSCLNGMYIVNLFQLDVYDLSYIK